MEGKQRREKEFEAKRGESGLLECGAVEDEDENEEEEHEEEDFGAAFDSTCLNWVESTE